VVAEKKGGGKGTKLVLDRKRPLAIRRGKFFFRGKL